MLHSRWIALLLIFILFTGILSYLTVAAASANAPTVATSTSAAASTNLVAPAGLF